MVLKLTLLSDSVFPVLKVEVVLISQRHVLFLTIMSVGSLKNLCVCLLVIHANYFRNVCGSRFIL